MSTRLGVIMASGMILAGAAGRAEATEYMFSLIDYPSATQTYAYGINDSGQIVGEYILGGSSHGFTWSGGVFSSFDHPTAATAGSNAYGINNSGQIVGSYDTPGEETFGAYLYDGDEYYPLTPFGSSWAFAHGINDSANVVGYYRDAGGVDRGFLFDGTSYTTLIDPNAVHTYPEGINNAGVIVGTGWETTGLPHAFVRDASGNFTDLYVGGFPGGATGINDLGQIAGDYGPTPDNIWGFVLTGGVNATPDKLVVPGATVTSALDINNLGRVVGMYSHGSWPDGPWRGFLATPIAAADFDKDGDVDAADLALWQGDFSLTADCDADADGDTDGADFLIWQRQYIAAVPGLGEELGVPEPASLCLMLMALGGYVLAARNNL